MHLLQETTSGMGQVCSGDAEEASKSESLVSPVEAFDFQNHRLKSTGCQEENPDKQQAMSSEDKIASASSANPYFALLKSTVLEDQEKAVGDFTVANVSATLPEPATSVEAHSTSIMSESSCNTGSSNGKEIVRNDGSGRNVADTNTMAHLNPTLPPKPGRSISTSATTVQQAPLISSQLAQSSREYSVSHDNILGNGGDNSNGKAQERPRRHACGSDNTGTLGRQASYAARSSSSGIPPSRHRRIHSNSDASYTFMSLEAADQLHASWTNLGNQDDLLSISSSAGFASTSNLGIDPPAVGRPLPISRLSSTASTMSATSAVAGHGSFLMDDFNNGISSAIHDAARITNWETVKDLCKEDPQAAKFMGRDKWTALHHACNRRCQFPDVVEALIKAYPDALLLEEDKGWYPLHYACRFKAPKEAVRLLLHLYPEKGRKAVRKRDRQGRTPLYYAVRYDAPSGVVGLLLDVDSSMVLEDDQNGDSPLGLVWENWAEKLEGKRTLQRLLVPFDKAENMTQKEKVEYVRKRLQSQSKVLDRWNTVNLFLRSAFGFQSDADGGARVLIANSEKEKKDPRSSASDRTWRILHATAAIKCHPSLVQLACAIHPDQSFEFDENDLIGPKTIHGGWQSTLHLSALHLAASSQANGDSGKTVLNQLLSINPGLSKEMDKDGNLPLHRIADNKAKAHWAMDGGKDIYMANTQAIRIPDLEGRMPLHRAANGFVPQGEATDETTMSRSVLLNLLELFPDASSHADNCGRLPFHYAVMNGTTWDVQLQSLYDAFPGAVRARTGVKLGNMLPLHMAANNASAEPSLIGKLLEYHPRASSQATREGKLPLHLACETGLSWETVRYIHEANPRALFQAEQNPRGWNVLQLAAASRNANGKLLSELLALDAEAASVLDSHGRFAFHLACVSGKTWENGLSTLFDANPEALRCADKVGLLPFHIACIRYCASMEDASNYEGQLPVITRKNHRRTSSRTSLELAQKEKEQEHAKEANITKQVDILYNLLRADPSIL